jgi:hypothetical protein
MYATNPLKWDLMFLRRFWDAESISPMFSRYRFFLCVIHKEGLSPRSGDINRLMMMMTTRYLLYCWLNTGSWGCVLNAVWWRQSRSSARGERRVDRAAESLVAVRGAEAQALFNFLLNCRSAAARCGPLAGVPPTLLAPTAFHGGTLHALKVQLTARQTIQNKRSSMAPRTVCPACDRGS